MSSSHQNSDIESIIYPSTLSPIQSLSHYLTSLYSMTKNPTCLLMDSQTASAISLVASQTDILKNNILLVDKLENENREKNLNLECVIMCRCTRSNVEYIKREISEPKYTDYTLIFTSFASQDDLEEVAQSDKKEVIKSVYEFYFDYHALDEYLFTLDVPSMIPMVHQDWDHTSMRRTTEGLLAALLSFQKLPSIRFQSNSEACKELARRIEKEVYRNEEVNRMLLKAQRRIKKNTMLLIFDRRDDPVTPLLTQWTYQAMVHENLSQKAGGIVLNRVSLEDKEPPVNIVLSSKDDEFFRENMTNNWGDLCLNIKDMVDRYKSKMNVREEIKTIDDIRNFITAYPQFKHFSNQVDKHVTLVHALKDVIASRNLLEISKLEQEMACSNHPKDHFRSLSQLVISPTTTKRDALRLSLLYALRYENYNGNANVEKLAQLLREEAGFKPKETSLLRAAQQFAGEQKRNKGLFGESGVFGALKNLHRTVGLTDVENVYTQHKPLIASVIEQAFIKSNKFNATYAVRGQESKAPPDELIIFIVGGVTYEESLFVHEWNKNPVNGERRVVLGGSQLLNSKAFMKEIQEFYKQQNVSDMLERLGSGSFGHVFLCTKTPSNSQSPTLYALKKIPLSHLSTNQKHNIVKECHILNALMHPNVVLYYESFLETNVTEGSNMEQDTIMTPPSNDDEVLCIVMEYCNGGSLHDILRLLRRSKSEDSEAWYIPENVLWKWFIQLLWALKYVHHKRIVHRDVKPMNLLLSMPSSNATVDLYNGERRGENLLHALYKCDLKLADFGVSRLLESSNAMAQTLVGTPLYLPPELVEGKPYDSKVDVWAIGCCWYELMMHKHPFEATNQAALVMKILEGKFAPISEHYSTEFAQLIYSCLEKDPARRHSCTELLELDIVKQKARELGLVLDESYDNFEIDVTKVSVSSAQARQQHNLDDEELYPRDENYRVETVAVQKKESVSHVKRVIRRNNSQRPHSGEGRDASPSYSHCIPPRPVATKNLNLNKISRIRRPSTSQRGGAATAANGGTSTATKRKGLSLRSNIRRGSAVRRNEQQLVRNLPQDPQHFEAVTSAMQKMEIVGESAKPRARNVVELHVKQPELVKILSSKSLSSGDGQSIVDHPEELHVAISLHDETSVLVQDDSHEEEVEEHHEVSTSVTWKVVDEETTDVHPQHNTSSDFFQRLDHVQDLERRISAEIGEEIMQEFIQYFTEHPNLSEEGIVQFAFGKISYGKASVVPLCRELVEERTEDILEYRIEELETDILSKINEQHYREILSFFMQKRNPTQEDIHRFVFGRIGYEHLELVHLIRQVASMRREMELKRVIAKD